ncbi:hypothetical protein FSP39_014382 [Pinctada imbricata]|uniref:Uncharacterized protein n=1 Tax=Pinctada imbricata TaxID=66713 RepID=A0AA88Y8K1_PINIB|nr:hypothetical protein FSP39_014382 [Pinctada imbricata]
MAAGRGSMPLGIYKKGINPSRVAVAKNFSSELSSADLADLVEKQFGIKTKAVYFHSDCRHVALLLLDESTNILSDLNVYSADKLVTLAPVGPAKGIVVDVPEGADLTMLQAYFDGDQSGVSGQYSHMDFVAGVLIIKIPNPNVQEVLGRVFSSSHILRHTELFIEPYYPEFHDMCFQLPKRKEPKRSTASPLKNVGSRTAPPASSRYMEGCYFPECQVPPTSHTVSGRLQLIDTEEDEQGKDISSSDTFAIDGKP